MKKWVCGMLFLAAVFTGCGGQDAGAASGAGSAGSEASEVVKWQFMPLMSSQYPAFPFRFELPFERVEAACDAGQLIGFDDHDGTEYPTGKALTVPEGSRLYWSPWDGADVSMEASVTFTVYGSGGEEYSGCITIRGTRGEHGDEADETEFVEATYLAVLEEQETLRMTSDEDGVKIVPR